MACVAPRHASLFIQVDGNRVATLCNYAALMKVMLIIVVVVMMINAFHVKIHHCRTVNDVSQF
jgi:hypothetical protein